MALRKYDIPGVQFDPWTPPAPHGPRPLPGNDNPGFRYRPKPKPGFGRKVPKLPGRLPKVPLRFLPGIGAGLAGIDLLDGLWPYPNPRPIRPPTGWTLVSRCETGPPNYWKKNYRVNANLVSQSDACIAGQADSSGSDGYLWDGVTPPFFIDRLRTTFWWRYDVGGNPAVVRAKHYETYQRSSGYSTGYGTNTPFALSPWPVGSPWPTPNPNLMRGMPGEPPLEFPAEPPPEVPFNWVWDSGPAGSPAPRPPTKRPPPSGMKEKKTRSRKIMVAFFEVMDAISENSEVINGFYEALPDAVQNKWKCAKKKGRQFIDSAGQYGIDHVDCKLEALWHNWHKVDAGEAIMNVAQNLTEDQLYGLLHKHLPPGAMQAMPDDTGKAWNEWVNGALELIFFGQ